MPSRDTKKENPLLSKNIPQPPAPAAAPTTSETDGNTVKQQNTAIPQNGKREKITFYPEPVQANKIYDLLEAYRRRTGVKINQQDLLRRLLEVANIDMLLPQ